MISMDGGEMQVNAHGARLTGMSISVVRDGDELTERLYRVLADIAAKSGAGSVMEIDLPNNYMTGTATARLG